jgi:DNA-binding LacI/PurR family transcriptional regulator
MARGVDGRHPTLQSVARAAGVSTQSVSNAFNAPHKLLPATLARIQAEVGRQGYRPDRSARSLRSRRTGLLGFSMPRAASASGAVGDRFVHAVTDAAERAGYHVLLFADTGTSAMAAYQALIAQRAVDGFVLADTTAGDRRQGWLAERNIAFAAFGRRWTDPEVGSWVDVDGAAGIAAIVRHLAEQGHRRLGFVGWPAGSGVGDDRLAGFERATRAAGLDVAGVERGRNDHATGARLTSRLLRRADPPTAVVCVSDDMAIGADAAVRAADLTPGRDVAITGFDDSPAAAVPALSLTSVRQPLDRAGEHVVRLLAACLADRTATAERVLLEPTVVVRASSSPRHPITHTDHRGEWKHR